MTKAIRLNDRAAFTITRREYTDEGFLKVPGHVSRTGTQQYLASELELTDRKPDDIVTIYRPPEEVFSADSLGSFMGVDVTNNHPDKLVDATTYKTVTAGVVVSAGRQVGDFVECDLIIKDGESVKAVEAGKVQLSAGYTSVYEHAPGVTSDGVEYEFIQRDIRINHVALVDRARAGFMARLSDSKPERINLMKHKVNLDSGRSVELEDAATAALVNDTIQRLEQRADDAEAKAEEAEKKQAEAEAAKDMAEEEAEKAKKASSDEALAARIADVTATIDAARKLAGDDFKTTSVDSVAIKREALTACNDSLNLDDKPAAYVEAYFDAALAGVKVTNNESKPSNDAQIKQLSHDAASTTPADKVVTSKRQAAVDSIGSAWKTTLGEA